MFQDKTLLFKPELNYRRIFIGLLLVYLSLVLYLPLVSLLNLIFESCFSFRNFFIAHSLHLYIKNSVILTTGRSPCLWLY